MSFKKKYFINSYLFLFLLLLFKNSNASVQYEIAATVNDEPISFIDLEYRIDFAIFASNIKNTNENRQWLLHKILNIMIDEKLKSQEALRLGVIVSSDEIEEAIVRIETQNNMKPGFLRNLFLKRKIPLRILEDHIKSELLWLRFIRERYVPVVKISSSELELFVDSVKFTKDVPYDLLREIRISFSYGQEDDANTLIYKLFEKLKKGANFQSVANQFSDAPSAAQGGDIGLVPRGSLGEEIDNAIKDLNSGDISSPIRTSKAYYIFQLLESKKSDVNIDQEQIIQKLTEERISLYASKELKRLRRVGFVDIRI